MKDDFILNPKVKKQKSVTCSFLKRMTTMDKPELTTLEVDIHNATSPRSPNSIDQI